MPIVPLYGHHLLRLRLAESAQRGALPSSLLIEGAPGIGKQRLALWLGQMLLCTGQGTRPCGECSDCRLSAELAHPDLRWFFPRPRLEGNVTPREALDDYAEAIEDRVKSGGLYPRPSGSDGIFISAVLGLIHIAARTPALAARKVLVVGEAERMVSQEGADEAANAFLKLLEEPPLNTTIVLTSSEPGALLPTIRSRVTSVRAAPLPAADMGAFLGDRTVEQTLNDDTHVPASFQERIALASGAPGTLIGRAAIENALAIARSMLAAATAGRAESARAALSLKVNKARGEFSDVLDALTILLGERMRDAAFCADSAAALAANRAIDSVEQAKLRAAGNVSPQLLGASLLRELLRP
ncbi:MAG: hypothetical protein ACR2OG_17970 [Gemmatimonadaceae bacterium]